MLRSPFTTAACILVVVACASFAAAQQSPGNDGWRQCTTTNFCYRTRERAPVSYSLSNVEHTDNGVTTFRLNAQNVDPALYPSHLEAELGLLTSGAVHFRVTESSDITDKKGKRFEAAPYVLVPDALTIEPNPTRFLDETYFTISRPNGTHGIKVLFKPFKMQYIINKFEVIAEFNSESFFNVEQRRARHASDPAEAWKETWDGWTDTKRFGPSALTFDVSFPESQALFGLPEHTNNIALKRTRGKDREHDEPYRLYNLDAYGHPLDSPAATYGIVPLVTSHSIRGGNGNGNIQSAADGKPLRETRLRRMYNDAVSASSAAKLFSVSAGVFFLNPSETFVDVGRSERDGTPYTRWMAESGVLELFFLGGNTHADVARQYHLLTGLPRQPPAFAMGYHQSRWNYVDDKDLTDVANKFTEYKIPMDVMWLDIDHTDQMKYFTWDKKAFPNPAVMQNYIGMDGRQLVTIVDPHIKTTPGYHVYDAMTAGDLFIKDGANNTFVGECWPGRSSWVDFTLPKARAQWGEFFALDSYNGSTVNLHIWNDMNEPSVFSGPEKTMPKDALHNNGAIEHRELHNLYGFLYNSASSDGLSARQLKSVPAPPMMAPPADAPKGSVTVTPVAGAAISAQRPFLLTRSFFAGTQRIGAVWTGDNQATWGFLRYSLPMLMNLGIGGISFSGADVGGFAGNPDVELQTRWYQAAALTPFFRAHSSNDTARREPWLYGEPHVSNIRDAIRVRYTHMPYVVTQFRHANATGQAPLRPLLQAFPLDSKVIFTDDVYMLGDAVLVAPVLEAGKSTVDFYMPLETDGKRSVWYDSRTLVRVAPKDHSDEWAVLAAPLSSIPVLYRGGRIIVTQQRARKATSGMTADPYTAVACLRDNAASGDVYIDDGATFKFLNGTYVYRKLAVQMTLPSASGVPGQLVFTSTAATVPSIVDAPAHKPEAVANNVLDSVHVLGFPRGVVAGKATVTTAAGVTRAVSITVVAETNVLLIQSADMLVSDELTVTIELTNSD